MGAYPNEVKGRREKALLTRRQLADLSVRAADTDAILYAPVSERSLERLERGEVQPRSKTAVTVAHVLGAEVHELFPKGIADFNRNPSGKNAPDEEAKPGKST